MQHRIWSRVSSSILIMLSLLLPWYQFSDVDTWCPGLVILIAPFSAGGWTLMHLRSLELLTFRLSH